MAYKKRRWKQRHKEKFTALLHASKQCAMDINSMLAIKKKLDEFKRSREKIIKAKTDIFLWMECEIFLDDMVLVPHHPKNHPDEKCTRLVNRYDMIKALNINEYIHFKNNLPQSNECYFDLFEPKNDATLGLY
jgi:hypothetical protein